MLCFVKIKFQTRKYFCEMRLGLFSQDYIVRNRTYVPSVVRWSLWVLGRGALGQRNFAHTQQALVFAKNDTVFCTVPLAFLTSTWHSSGQWPWEMPDGQYSSPKFPAQKLQRFIELNSMPQKYNLWQTPINKINGRGISETWLLLLWL